MKTLKEFSDEINNILHMECELINTRNPDALFKAVHHTMPESFFSYYYNNGMSIKETIEDIKEESKSY